jgi:hypothetical protein
MLIVEDVLLMALDPESGRATWPNRRCDAGRLAAAALLLDLLLADYAPSAASDDAHAPVHPLLRTAARALRGRDPAAVETSLMRLARALPRPVERVLDGLSRRDIVHHFVRRRRLLLREHYYPLRSMQARNQAHARLYDAAFNATDRRGLAFLMLMDACGLLPRLVEGPVRECAQRRLQALAATDHGDDAIGAIARARDCLLTA